MISVRDMVMGIYCAWRLLLFDRSAVQLIDATSEGFWKSFYAAVIALPGVIVLYLLTVTANPDFAPTATADRITIVFVITYVIQWVSFPLVMFYIADLMGRSRQYIPFVVAYNWSQVVQTVIMLPAGVILALAGVGEPGWANVVFLAALLAIAVYAWFIARTALDITGIAATLIVFIDIAIVVVISLASELMIGTI